MGQVFESAAASQLQEILDDTDYLDTVQSGFRLSFGTETALAALVDDLRMDLDSGSVSLPISSLSVFCYY